MDCPTLGDLTDLTKYTEALDVAGCEVSELIEQLRMMWTIRLVEEKLGDMVTAQKIVCPCHLGIGEEAIAVGVSAHLRKTDRVFGAHRSHSHYLAQGGSIYGLLAEVLGKVTGCSKGMGGSMHLYDAPNGFMGSVPIVAGTVPLAAGAALAAKMDRQGDVAVGYFGDGAAEEGPIHEALNFASNFKLPILFVCENNLFSSHLHIDLRQPSNAIARFALAHKIPYEIVDGNDLVAVSKATASFVEHARRGEGPGFLETVTYRWRGHVGPREDVDVGVHRSSEELQQWKKRDPIRRLVDALKEVDALNDTAHEQMQQELRSLIDQDWLQAEAAPFPEPSQLLDVVYQT